SHLPGANAPDYRVCSWTPDRLRRPGMGACNAQENSMAAAKPLADFAHFEALDIRVGRIAKVEDAQTRKPTYRMTVDFGPEIGTKISCGAYHNYPRETLIGQQVLAV